MKTKNIILLTASILFLIPFIFASLPQVIIPLTTPTVYIVNGTALGTCQYGYAIQNITGTGIQCVDVTSNSSSFSWSLTSDQSGITGTKTGSYTLNTTGSCECNNLIATGNFSAKRPYYYGYYNATDNFLNTANAQKMNLTNNNDVDKYLININSSQDITFQQTGDYKCIVSPEFYQSSGGTALATFWMRKNGVDVPWSNSRYSIPNTNYNAPNINFPFDITNPATDYVSFYWWSDSTNTQLYSSGVLTNPSRPSIPAVLIQCEKMSEVTP